MYSKIALLSKRNVWIAIEKYGKAKAHSSEADGYLRVRSRVTPNNFPIGIRLDATPLTCMKYNSKAKAGLDLLSALYSHKLDPICLPANANHAAYDGSIKHQ